jgi:hypothetical protein
MVPPLTAEQWSRYPGPGYGTARHPQQRQQTRTTTPTAAPARFADRPPKPKRQAPPPKPAPCPADAERHRLSVWDALGWLPDGVEPCAIAAAHCRVFGKPSPRDPAKRTARSYSLRELGLALGELGRAFEPEPLRKVWRRALDQLDLPSTRTLLAQQARLVELRGALGMPGTLLAEVAVQASWLEMAHARRQLLADAMGHVLGQTVAVVLQEVKA